jgi:hypothetical protein
MKRVLVAALLFFATACGTARADGDPASDFLYTRETFVPYDLKIDPAAKRDFVATVRAANRNGFNIRVAIIGNAFDLGAVPSLFRKPRTYAHFLGAELAFVYKQRLLVVMPNGFGFYWKGHAVTQEYATLGHVSVGRGATGLVVTARAAVEALEP